MADRPALSNRQRRAQRKVTLAQPRRTASAGDASGARAEPKAGVAHVADLQDQLKATDAVFGLAVACAMLDAGGGKLKRAVVSALQAEFGYEAAKGEIRMRSRDGLLSLHSTRAIDERLVKAGLAYRHVYEGASSGVASGMGALGGAPGGSRKVVDLSSLTLEELKRARSKAELHRAYLMVRLNGMERAVAAAIVDGRELLALRMVVGEGRTVRSLTGGGKAATQYASAVKRALDAIATHLEEGLANR